MRAGAYTIHQSLTAEAAAVLKLALGLARQRGHAQVTPLHVAFALLTAGGGSTTTCPPAFSSSSSSAAAAAYGLLKRACLRSHPASSGGGAAAHPLQCRALELCFNVALNRLPNSSSSAPPHSAASSFASSLIQPSPTLSNALVAALKRAQANQRRGSVELHQPPPPQLPASTQQQQPLLAIKVELDQLVISILDDPSVSRVMREAGFSSATVKSNLEEQSALAPPPSSSSSSPPPPPQAVPPSHFFLDPTSITGGGGGGFGGMWPTQFLAAPCMAVPSWCKDDDVCAVLEVMVRKQGRRSNPVVVGDSASMAEAVAGELLRRLERGGDDVPDELAGAHLLRLHLSYVHVRLMSRADVDARAAELRRAADAARLHRGGGGLVVYVGDLRWALVDEEPPAAAPSSYCPVEHMVAELGRLLDYLRASRGRAWLVATASYQTYMRWQQRRRRQPPALEDAWALQAVLVPTGGGTGLALNNLHPSASAAGAAAAVQPGVATTHQPGQRMTPFAMVVDSHPTARLAADRDGRGQQETLVLCSECGKNYEREAASLVKAEDDHAEGPRGSTLPAWLMVPADQAQQHKDKYLLELKRKWSRLCRKVHLHVVDSPRTAAAPCPWWSGPCLPVPSRPSMAGLLGLEGHCSWVVPQGGKRTSEWPPARWGLTTSLREPPSCQEVGTALALGNGNLPLSDTATSDGRHDNDGGLARELERRLRRNVPWQPAAVAAGIAEAVAAGQRRPGNNAVWLFVKGGSDDHVAVRRSAKVIAEARSGSGSGSADVVVCADTSTFGCAEEFASDVVSRASAGVGGGRRNRVLVLGDVARAPEGVVDCLVAASRSGSLKDPSSGKELDLSGSVVILTTSKLASTGTEDVISLRVWSEDDDDDDASCGKRKPQPDTEPYLLAERKRPRRYDARRGGLDLNVDLWDAADEDEDEDGSNDEAVPSDITHEGSSVDDDDPRISRLLASLAARVAVVTLADEREQRPIRRGHLRARLTRTLLGGSAQPPLSRTTASAARVSDEAVDALAAAAGHFLDETLERWGAEVLEPAAAAAVSRSGGKVAVLGVGGPSQTTGFMGSVLPCKVHVD